MKLKGSLLSALKRGLGTGGEEEDEEAGGVGEIFSQQFFNARILRKVL